MCRLRDQHHRHHCCGDRLALQLSCGFCRAFVSFARSCVSCDRKVLFSLEERWALHYARKLRAVGRIFDGGSVLTSLQVRCHVGRAL